MNIINVGQALSLMSLITSASYNATTTGTGVDISDYEGDVAIILDAGVKTAGTNPTLDVTIEESDTLGSGYSAVSGAAFTQCTTTASQQKLVINSDQRKKYIRAVGTIGGTSTPTFPISVTAVGIKKYPA